MGEKSKKSRKTDAYLPLSPEKRISMVTDLDSFIEWDADLCEADPLMFHGYREELEQQREATGLSDAVITGMARVDGMPVAIAVMSVDFMQGTMGEIVGERLTRMIERATEERLPVVIFCSSRGARVQEGVVALMQMAKAAGALKKHDEAGLYYLPILTDPTVGGVVASIAMIGDTILAEPGALISFAGTKVLEQTAGQKLPEGFQRAEFWQEHGFVDKVVKREHLKKTISFLIAANGGQRGATAEGRMPWSN